MEKLRAHVLEGKHSENSACYLTYNQRVLLNSSDWTPSCSKYLEYRATARGERSSSALREQKSLLTSQTAGRLRKSAAMRGDGARLRALQHTAHLAATLGEAGNKRML